jgi:peptidoglycan/xylan/chitin deacetylase (PgdA/CDA1 family)
MSQARLPFSPTYLLGQKSAVLPVVMYHRVLREADPLRPGVHAAQAMDTQFSTLKRYFQVLPLDVAIDLLQRGKLPPRAVCITFDDGYRDNHDVALPLLQRHGLHATFYVSTGFLNGGVMFHDLIIESVRQAPTGMLDWGIPGAPVPELSDTPSRQRAVSQLTARIKYMDPALRANLSERLSLALGPALPRHLMMDDAQVRALFEAGMGVGGHTCTHPIMAMLSEPEAAAEVIDNRDTLRDIIGVLPGTFAYPNGKPGKDFGPRDRDLVVSAGYRNAMSTLAGVSTTQTHGHEMPRFVLNEATPLRIVMRVLRMTAFPITH